MKKNYWINSILQSASEINEVEANPYLFDKVNLRISNIRNAPKPSFGYKLGWAVAMALMLALNASTMFIYRTKIHKQIEAASVAALTDELNSITTYNY